jgi:hypothetical protein
LARLDALERTRPAAPAAAALPDDTDLTPEEEQQYQASLSVIDKRARRQARALVDKEMATLRQEMQSVRQETGSLTTGLAASTEANFIASVRGAVVPLGGMDKIVKHPEWPKYLDQDIPLLGVPIKTVLQQHHNARNLDGVLKVFEGFKPEANPLAAQEVPSANAASAAPAPAKSEGRKLPISKLREANAAYTRGRMTADEYGNIRKVYERAEAEGRVLMDR